MEYLPLPEDPALQPIEIKFQDAEKYWYDGTWKEHIDGTYWYNFPARYGYKLGDFWIEHGEQSNQAWAHRGFWTWIMNQPRAKLEGIAIGWLYFGTLAEVTCCALDIKDYLHITDNGERVLKLTSQMMDHHLIRWHAISRQFNGSVYIRGSPYRDPHFTFAVFSEAFITNRDGLRTQFGATLDEKIEFQARLDHRGRSLQFERAHRCLQRSKAIIKLLCETIDPKTAYVIASLHEFRATAMGVIFKGEVTDCYDLEERGRWSLGRWVEFDFTLYNRDVMQALGWCPLTIEHVLTRHDRSLALDYFATNLKSHQTSEDHSKCSKDICVAYQLDSDAYTVKHTTDHPGCECAHLEMDLDIAAAILIRVRMVSR